MIAVKSAQSFIDGQWGAIEEGQGLEVRSLIQMK